MVARSTGVVLQDMLVLQREDSKELGNDGTAVLGYVLLDVLGAAT